MFGERYFATRERLSGLLLAIGELASETNTDLGDSLTPAEIRNGLATPFLFVVCGEVNAGKSTLINGLFGHDLCRVNVLPETHRVLWYRYGNSSRDVESTPLLGERYRPAGFLRNFNLIDTPGTNSAVQGHHEVTERFIPTADLTMFVFPVTNPWCAATWDLISRLSAESLENTAIVIQQADQRAAKDIEVILGHMKDLSMKRIGRTLPIFAVSGKLAFEARTTSPPDKKILATSGYARLETFISTNVCQSPARQRVLEEWRGHTATALRAVEDRIEQQSRAINMHSRFMEDVEREIDGIRETFVGRLPSHLAEVAVIFETEASWVTRLLRSRLGALPSIARLFVGDRTGPKMEAAFIERLQSAVESVAEKDGTEVAAACHEHWKDLGERVRTNMGVDPNPPQTIEATLTAARDRFVQRLGKAARQGIGNLKVRNRLDKELRRRNRSLKAFVVTSLLLTTIGATCGALEIPWLPTIFCSLAALFLAGGILAAWVTRKSISHEFQSSLLDTCGAFASTLHTDYEEALRLVFRDYSSSLGNVQTHLAHEKLAIEPRQRKWQDLFLTLKAIEQEL